MGYAHLTPQDIFADPEVRSYVEQGNRCMEAIGFTEHGLAHAKRSSDTARDILRLLGYPERTCELAAIALQVAQGTAEGEVTAPEGYQLAEDVTFAVEETSEIQFVGMVDEPSPEEPEEPEEPSTPDEPTEPEEPTPTMPQTGGSRAALWVGALLILALGGLGITLLLLQKQNKL